MLNLLKRFSGAYRRYFFIGPLAKLVEACFDLITPLVVASMIDNGVGARDMGSVVRHGLVLVAMAVVGISVTLVCQKVAALTSQGMGTDMRRELYAHINRLSFADLDRFGTPSLITRITNDVNQVDSLAVLGGGLHGGRAVDRCPPGADLFGDHPAYRRGVLAGHG